MESREFQVEVVGRHRTVYRVLAPDVDSARRLASSRWQRSEASDIEGFDWCEVEAIRATETRASVLQRQDEQLVLRFIRERERLLFRLGSVFLAATANDAISATQAAMDLGWFIPDGSALGTRVVDTLRAAQALERLCETNQLVCFERTRSREGERGEIRLYCTPDYLEYLSASLDEPSNVMS